MIDSSLYLCYKFSVGQPFYHKEKITVDFINVFDYEVAAREKLPKMVYDYYASGSDDEVALTESQAAYGRIKLQYRVLRGIGQANLSTTVLGQPLALPILIAPMGFQGMAHPDGELATVRAASQAGTIMILSTASNAAMEEVVAATDSPVWFQLYMYKDRGITTDLIRRAEAAGCTAIALTVDTPTLGKRERDVRNRFQLPPGLALKNFMATDKERFPQGVSGSGLAAYTTQMFKMALSWEDVDWLCSITRLPVLLKGVAHPEDARLGLAHGSAGIIVSNHGGRQLDAAPATIEVLPEIVEAVQDAVPVLVDGGIRRGSDVVKALALGAKAVCVGRPVLWGVAVDGQAGAGHVLELLRQELETVMVLRGCATLDEIDPGLIFRRHF
jgi:4-hydroxymandelate oxidase